MKDSFVYIWENLSNGNKYIGYHKGAIDDGYVCSSSSDRFWNDFNDPSMEWNRQIIFEGTAAECLAHEQELLSSIDLKSDLWYNNARGSSIIFTDEVKDKIRQRRLGGTSGMKGKTHTEDTKRRQSEALKGRTFTEEHKQNLRKPNKDSSNKRGPKSEEHRANMKKPKVKLECPRCHKFVAPNVFYRWHNENCKA